MRRIPLPQIKQAQRFARDSWEEDWRLEMKADGEAAEAAEQADLERESEEQ